MNKNELQKKLAWEFKNKNLLEMALTHTSYANEAKQGEKHNERLEFLGDAVLELCISQELYKRFPTVREGDLTRMRSWLVSEPQLAIIARDLNIDKLIKLGKGEEQQGGRNRDAILADAFEALLGAIFEDGGFSSAQKSVSHIFAKLWPEHVREPQLRDNKSLLQEKTQHLFGGFPIYSIVDSFGPDHAKIYEICVTLPDGRKYSAKNTSCKKAEQDAASAALEDLNKKGLDDPA